MGRGRGGTLGINNILFGGDATPFVVNCYIYILCTTFHETKMVNVALPLSVRCQQQLINKLEVHCAITTAAVMPCQ